MKQDAAKHRVFDLSLMNDVDICKISVPKLSFEVLIGMVFKFHTQK